MNMNGKKIIERGTSFNYQNRKWIARKPTNEELLKYKPYKVYTNKLEQKTIDLSLSGIFEYRGRSYPLYDNNDLMVADGHEFWKGNDYAIVDGDYFTYEIDKLLKVQEIKKQSSKEKLLKVEEYEEKVRCKITDIIKLLDSGILYFIYNNKIYKTNRFYIDEHSGVIPEKPNTGGQYFKEIMNQTNDYSFPKLPKNIILRYILSDYGINFAASKEKLKGQIYKDDYEV